MRHRRKCVNVNTPYKMNKGFPFENPKNKIPAIKSKIKYPASKIDTHNIRNLWFVFFVCCHNVKIPTPFYVYLAFKQSSALLQIFSNIFSECRDFFIRKPLEHIVGENAFVFRCPRKLYFLHFQLQKALCVFCYFRFASFQSSLCFQVI